MVYTVGAIGRPAGLTRRYKYSDAVQVKSKTLAHIGAQVPVANFSLLLYSLALAWCI